PGDLGREPAFGDGEHVVGGEPQRPILTRKRRPHSLAATRARTRVLGNMRRLWALFVDLATRLPAHAPRERKERDRPEAGGEPADRVRRDEHRGLRVHRENAWSTRERPVLIRTFPLGRQPPYVRVTSIWSTTTPELP